jgi:hypothetical protein
VILRLADTVSRGRAVAVDRDVDPETVARAIREGTADESRIAVLARRPPPVHERVGCLRPSMGLRTRTALAEAGRARGLSTRFDAAIRKTRRALEELSAPAVEAGDERRAVAKTSTETARLRERVAAARGRLAAHRELDADTDDPGASLEAAARDLSEAETSAVAARERLNRTREKARSARATLDRRMRLEDELANQQRQARALLVDRLRDAFASAVAAAPGGPDSRPADTFAVDAVTAGLAVARIADFDAPVVLACDRFPDADAASAWLGAPVVQIR